MAKNMTRTRAHAGDIISG